MTGLLGLAALLAVSTSASASIQLSGSPLDGIFSLDAGQEFSNVGMGASSSSTPANSKENSPAQGGDEDSDTPGEFLLAFQVSPEGTTSGASTSTSGTGGTSTSPLDSAAIVSLSDSELVVWLCSEQRFSLPMPPGNELLRPPQD